MSERLQDIELRLLLEGIFLRYSHDFRNYSKASLKRRVLQALTRFDCPSISALQERVLRDPALFAELLQFLAPSIQFALAITVFGEALTPIRLACFALIWAGLVVYVAGAMPGRRAAAPEQP